MPKPAYNSGTVVEVRSYEEIRATLDADGMFEGVPFMDEMREFCGRRFRVFKRAEKMCVERPYHFDLRRMHEAVFLEEVRCDGGSHDGCGRLCMVFWKEAWLKPAPPGASPEPPIDWTEILRRRAPSRQWPEIDPSKTYRCQSTALYDATEHLRLWDLRHYVRDTQTGSLRPPQAVKVVLRVIYNTVAGAVGKPEFGKVVGTNKKTPLVVLGLRPGEVVRVKRKSDVALTLDERGRNRGLGFGDTEVSRHCGKTYTVLSRVDRMILEDTGKMRKIENTVLLQGSACEGLAFRGCARHSHPMWREAWVDRIEAVKQGSDVAATASTSPATSG
jgi:hypothetical protein